RASPFIQRASDAWASAMALASSTRQKAFSRPSTAAIRSRQDRAASTGDSSRRAKAAVISVADRRKASVMILSSCGRNRGGGKPPSAMPVLAQLRVGLGRGLLHRVGRRQFPAQREAGAYGQFVQDLRRLRVEARALGHFGIGILQVGQRGLCSFFAKGRPE